MTNRLWTIRRHRLRNIWPRWSNVLLSAAIVFFLMIPILQESWEDVLEFFNWNDSCNLQEVELPAPYTFQDLYGKAFRFAGRDKPRYENIASIGIPGNLLPLKSDLCVGRLFMADLIHAVSLQQPKAIVIDKTYSSGICKGETGVRRMGSKNRSNLSEELSERAMTTKLVESVLDATSRQPVILAVGTAPTGRANEPCLQETTSNLFDPDYLAANYEKAYPGSISKLGYGYSRLDTDPSEIPLKWQRMKCYAGSHETFDGLAMAAAKASYPNFQDALLQSAYRGRPEHPFGFFAREREESISTGSESKSPICVLATAGGGQDLDGYVQCDDIQTLTPTAAPKLNSMRGKIVVIGSEDDGDRELVSDHSMFGYELQSHYIAALLGHAYLREWPLLVRLLLSLCVPFLIERAVYVWKPTGKMHHSEYLYFVRKAPVLRTRKGYLPVYFFSFSLVVLLFLSSVIALHCGWMPPFPLLAAMLGLLVLKTSECLGILREQRDEARTTQFKESKA